MTTSYGLRRVNFIVKQNKDAAALFIEQKRADLAEEYTAQIEVMQRYLPAQMSDAELTTALKAIIARLGATSMQDLGKVMGIASKELTGKAEGRTISEKVKQLLSGN